MVNVKTIDKDNAILEAETVEDVEKAYKSRRSIDWPEDVNPTGTVVITITTTVNIGGAGNVYVAKVSVSYKLWKAWRTYRMLIGNEPAIHTRNR